MSTVDDHPPVPDIVVTAPEPVDDSERTPLPDTAETARLRVQNRRRSSLVMISDAITALPGIARETAEVANSTPSFSSSQMSTINGPLAIASGALAVGAAFIVALSAAALDSARIERRILLAVGVAEALLVAVAAWFLLQFLRHSRAQNTVARSRSGQERVAPSEVVAPLSPARTWHAHAAEQHITG
jgi:hypothetical protein